MGTSKMNTQLLKMNTLYIIQKCKKGDNQYFKTTHGSNDGYRPICGIELDHKWAITIKLTSR